MIIKSEELFIYFLRQLKQICFYPETYENTLNKIEEELKVGNKDIFKAGFGNQPFEKIKFIGSFFSKKMGDYLSDIDVIEVVEYDEKFVERWKVLLENIDKTAFIYMRFYCGEDKNLIPPWSIDGEGSCKFSLIEAEEWYHKVMNYEYLPEKGKMFLKRMMDKNTLSMRDLLEVEEEMKKYNTVPWEKDDLIKGYKIYNGQRFDLLNTLQTYDKKKTIRYVFLWENDSLLVDYSLRETQRSIEPGSIEVRAFYFEDPIKIIKMYKRWIYPDYNDEYARVLNESTRKYTTIAFRLDMIMRIRRYKLLSEEKLLELEADLNEFIRKKGKDYEQFLLRDNNIDSVYEKILSLIREEATKGINYMNSVQRMMPLKQLLTITIYELRSIEVQKQIPKSILQYRINKGYSCPFFQIDLSDLINLYYTALNCKVNPKVLLKCVYEVCEKSNCDLRMFVNTIFSKQVYKIERYDRYTYSLYSKATGKTTLFPAYDLKKMQIFAIFATFQEYANNLKEYADKMIK